VPLPTVERSLPSPVRESVKTLSDLFGWGAEKRVITYITNVFRMTSDSLELPYFFAIALNFIISLISQE